MPNGNVTNVHYWKRGSKNFNESILAENVGPNYGMDCKNDAILHRIACLLLLPWTGIIANIFFILTINYFTIL